jgi:hypothetical protein
MAKPHEADNHLVTANPLSELLRAPLDPEWTVEGLAEKVLGAIAAQRLEEAQEFVLDADALTDRQSRRLLRPLLACLATRAAAEGGTPANLYGGHFSFERSGPNGPVWILGQFENRPGSVRVTLRRSNSPPRDLPMDEILLPLHGCLLPSYSGTVMYTVTQVEPGSHVTLTSPNRQEPSVLPWADIAQVYRQGRPDVPLAPAVVDAILGNPDNRDSSTMCALVLAMRNPSRVHRL